MCCNELQMKKEALSVINQNLYRPRFAELNASAREALMGSLADEFGLAFKGMETFSRWGQTCCTGVFEPERHRVEAEWPVWCDKCHCGLV